LVLSFKIINHLVSEYKLFKRSNKANILIALVQKPVFQMKMTFQEIRIIATDPCIALYNLIQPTISLEMPVLSQDHYGFHSFPVVD
jgi:hypothetical protein